MPVDEVPVPILINEESVTIDMEELPIAVPYEDYAMGADMWAMGAGMTAVFIILIIWSMVWKAMALWRAARNNHLAWYIVLMLLNTAGILDILYYFIWGKKKSDTPTPPVSQ